ncbi:uncharacterized protein LOC119084941 [Bradysia coprophila]|uniref:uncharacterized protein LOC119084941 n=1 Tax=Bradysia coprophila TaxID=38358 RepID=UPI00187D7B32|nr:uncharacterized protein LOC119084941 [Bradysia coprophila]
MDVSRVAFTTTIYNLPNEMLDNIFGHLSIYDIGRCMMVCKQWLSIGIGFKIKELIFKRRSDTCYIFRRNEWCTKELIDENMMILDKLFPLSSLVSNTKFLGRLSICGTLCNNFELVHLNKFVHLEHLELESFWHSQRGITFLNLPKLKILRCYDVEQKVVFNAPILSEVYFSASESVRFRNLPTLKLLDYDTNGNEGAYVFNRIKSVEVFRIGYNRNLHVMLDVLTHLNDVKEIRYDFRPITNSMDRTYFEEEFADVFEERRLQNKMHVQIYMFDILIVEGKSIDEYGFDKVSIWNGRYPFHIH